MICLFVCLFVFMLKLLQYCNYIIIVMQIKLMLLLLLEKESDNFCVVFTYSIKRAREIRKFDVAVVQRRQRNVENSMMRVQSCCLLI